MIGERIKMNIICFNLNQILKYCGSNKVRVKTEDGRFQIKKHLPPLFPLFQNYRNLL